MSESENILLERFAGSGDAHAFAEIVGRHAGLVYGACLRVLSDSSQAADATQETFFQLLRNAGTITGSLPGWLHRVATNKAVDIVRKDSKRRHQEAKYAADKPREAKDWESLSPYVDEELTELDEQTRDVLIQRFFEGRTMSDIAADKGVSQPTVSRKIESGVSELRSRLRNRGLIVAAAGLVSLLAENAVQAAPAVILKELGKMAIVGSAAGTGTAAAASTTKAAATGILAGIKAKVVTAAAVATVGVGTVITYNHIAEEAPAPAPEPVSSYSQSSTPTSKPAASRRQTTVIDRLFAEPEPVYEAEAEPEPVDEDYINEEEPVVESGVTEPETKTQVRGGGMMGGGYYSYRYSRSAEETEEPNSAEDEDPRPRTKARRRRRISR